MTYYYHQVADGDVPSPTEITNWKRDTKRFKKNKRQTRRNLIKGYHNQIFNRMTLPNSSVTALLSFSLFALVHTVYA